MQAVAERSPLLEGYETFVQNFDSQSESFKNLRQEGLTTFSESGIPSSRQEEWRKTNLASLQRTSFLRVGEAANLSSQQIQPFRLPDCVELVFVNGRFSRELSSDHLPNGMIVASLADALTSHTAQVEPHLGQYADSAHPFVALNTAYLEDGAFLFVPRGVAIDKTIHVLFLSTSHGDQATVSYPRNLFVAEEGSQVTIVESYAGFGDEKYFTCPVTEIVGAAGSVVDHYRLGQESLGAFHVATQKVHLGRDANFFTHSINHGGALVRNDIQAMLDAEGIHCTLNGLYLARGTQHVDHQMRVDHAKPNCHSYELFKGILEGRSRAVFNGRIFVHEDAQKTDAKQSNRNLLLSPDALVHSNPQLEIFADDVRCTHGSTTGHLDEEAVFYLRSRGIGEEAARSLLIYSFAGEVLDEIRLKAVREDLEQFLFTRLPKGDIVSQAV